MSDRKWVRFVLWIVLMLVAAATWVWILGNRMLPKGSFDGDLEPPDSREVPLPGQPTR